MKLDKIDKILDNPKSHEARQFKPGGFFSIKRTKPIVKSRKRREDDKD